MLPSSRGFSSFSSQQSGQNRTNSVGERFPVNRTLMGVIKKNLKMLLLIQDILGCLLKFFNSQDIYDTFFPRTQQF